MYNDEIQWLCSVVSHRITHGLFTRLRFTPMYNENLRVIIRQMLSTAMAIRRTSFNMNHACSNQRPRCHTACVTDLSTFVHRQLTSDDYRYVPVLSSSHRGYYGLNTQSQTGGRASTTALTTWILNRAIFPARYIKCTFSILLEAFKPRTTAV